ncbi:MAG: C4-dicarboxylic acid transporter DauA [Myxococcota bacterium]
MTSSSSSVSSSSSLPDATALRRVVARGYRWADLQADLFAGVVVGIVALPLSMALAIGAGVPPQHGLYTAVVAGAATALLGGCKFQVTGPTAAFVVILAPIASQYGLQGLLTAGFLAGLALVLLGFARLGSLIRFVPYPVTTGFTTGIAVVIATIQVKDVLGLGIEHLPDRYVDKLAALWAARGTIQPEEAVVAAATLALLLGVPRLGVRIPAPLVAVGTVSVAVAALHAAFPAFDVATIGSRFPTTVDGVEYAGIPPVLPRPALPWGAGLPSWALIEALLPSAFAIAMLGAIESLLSAVIADGLTGKRHDPNAELVGLGVGNLLAPLFGGIAATGALARTATNIRSGARSPLAAVVHAAVVLLAIALLAPLVAYVPMAALGALLLLVAWNMSEVHHFVGLLRIAPKSDVAVLLTCFLLTVWFDMVVAVTVGFLLAAILFMRRMAELTEARLVLDGGNEAGEPTLPPGVSLYQINGPLFFGAARTALDALGATNTDFRVLVLDLSRVPVVDATGIVALRSALDGLHRAGKRVVLAGPLPRPDDALARAGLLDDPRVVVAPDLPSALRAAER